MVAKNIVRLVVAALIGAALVVPSTAAQAKGRHHRHHHRHHRQMHMNTSMLSPTHTYGQYPNVVFFKDGGHTYARNTDDMYTYLVK